MSWPVPSYATDRFRGACGSRAGQDQAARGDPPERSLSQAARDLGMSYRRAWMLIASLNGGGGAAPQVPSRCPRPPPEVCHKVHLISVLTL